MSNIFYLTPSNKNSVNPLYALLFAALLAIGMVLITFTIFINSSAYDTVKQIQIGANKITDLGPGYDVTSPVNAKDIDSFAASVDARLKPIDDTADFNQAMISNTALGL